MNKRLGCAAVGFALFFSCSTPAYSDSTPGMDQWLGWVLVPGKQAGPIDESTSEADLIQIYGMRHVVEKGPSWDNAGALVHEEPATQLFPGDVGRCAEITWKDPVARRQPKQISLCCTRCYWRTAEGVTIGTEAQRLKELNGGDYAFQSFFGSDPGQIHSWDGGHLEDTLPVSGILMSLDYHHEVPLSAVDQAVLGAEGTLQSDNAVASKLDPYVSALKISFEAQPSEIANRQ